jgi:hypothetical protein
MVRHFTASGLAVVVIGALAACGGKPAPAAPPPQTMTVQAPPSSAAIPASSGERPEQVRKDQTPRCTAETLKGEIGPGNAAAGNRYAKLVVTNTGKATCTLYGYGGLALIGGPTKLTRKPDPGPALVTLQPGQKAFKNLHWGVVPAGDEPVDGPCEPPSTGATVIPPDETQPFTVKFDFGPVCQHGAIDGSAYYR